ncbi:ribonuclease protein [Trifolium repens]|nr:ribonuclease protein [Trifolium repens]
MCHTFDPPCKLISDFNVMFHSIERDEGTPQNKIFVTSVQIATPGGRLKMIGDEKSRLKDAQNSAASLMIRALQQGKSKSTSTASTIDSIISARILGALTEPAIQHNNTIILLLKCVNKLSNLSNN